MYVNLASKKVTCCHWARFGLIAWVFPRQAQARDAVDFTILHVERAVSEYRAKRRMPQQNKCIC